jgi:hypothetical protein
VVYIAQTAVFLTGTLPYGTYWDAGFTGVPSSGSVSIERGHFGKFLAPLFPFYVLLLIRSRWRAAFALFLGVSLVNFSASSIAFIAGYAAITAALLRRDLLRPAVAAAGVVLLGAVAALGVVFGEQYGAVFQKIVDVGVRGEEVGGRGLPVLEAYLARFPLGTGYGGSTLRVVGELPEINMGGFALISQLSAVALPIVLGFVWLNWRVLRASRGTTDARTRGLLVCGVIMSGLIGVVDILWFVPTIWAPLVIADGLAFAARGGVPAPAGVAAAGRPAADPPFRTLPHPPR